MEPGYCSVCLEHVASRFHFPAHARICAGPKREREDVTQEQIKQLILSDDVRAVGELLENHLIPREMVAFQYARSIGMAELLEGNLSATVDKRHTALEAAGVWFNARQFLYITGHSTHPILKQMIDVRDDDYVVDPTRLTKIVFVEGTKRYQKLDDGTHSFPLPRTKDRFFVTYYSDLIFHGFFPVMEPSEDAWPYLHMGEMGKIFEDMYFRRYSPQVLDFWTTVENFAQQDIYSQFDGVVWTTGSASTFIDRAQHSPYSFPLFVLGMHDKIYKESRRAVTDMSMFRTADSKLVRRPLPDNLIPVTRYASGMKGGLFYEEDDEKEQEYCGTFYYVEPESTTFLRYEKALRMPDKKRAYEFLSGETVEYGEDDTEELVLKKIADDPTIDLYFTPSEFFAFLRTVNVRPENERGTRIGLMWKAYNDNPGVRADTVPYYCAFLLGVYAFQDSYDQSLCKLASDEGYDVIILERMVGSHQIVAEVLDTRYRKESFQNLHFLEN